MTDRALPLTSATARRRLSRELVRLRSAHGLTLDDVRRQMEWSYSKTLRIEQGVVAVSVNDVKNLLGLYGIGQDEREYLIELARRSYGKRLTDVNGRAFTAVQLEVFDYEPDATTITQYHPVVIPDIAQVADYAKVCCGIATDSGTDVRATRMEVLAKRQRRLLGLDEDPAAKLNLLIEQYVLQRPIGGSSVLRKQLRHLLDLSEHPRVRLAILPPKIGAHLGMRGPFTLIEFDNDPPVLYREWGPLTHEGINDPADISAYSDAVTKLLDRAMPPRQAEQLLGQLLR